MWNLLSLSKNSRAVSEIMGQVLIAGITFMALVTVGLFFLAQDGPDYAPNVEIQQWVNASSDVIYLKHCGGDPLSFDDTSFIVSVNGNKYELTEEELFECMGKNSWYPGEVIAIDTYEMWGALMENDDIVDVFLVDQNSNQLIQKADMPLQGMCPLKMKPGSWYFFTTVAGDDWKDGDNLNSAHDYDLAVNLSAVPDGKYNDTYLGLEGMDYKPNKTFNHSLKNDPLDLTFGFNNDDFLWPRKAHNATILMIYNLQQEPSKISIKIAGEDMPIFDPKSCGTKEWHMYNQTVPIKINSISDLKFQIHVEGAGQKSIAIDYLAVCLT